MAGAVSGSLPRGRKAESITVEVPVDSGPKGRSPSVPTSKNDVVVAGASPKLCVKKSRYAMNVCNLKNLV